MRVSASRSPSTVVGLVMNENAPVRKAVLAILVERDHLHGNVPRQRILLQLAEHAPAEHVGQEDVERHGIGIELRRQRQRLGAALRDQHLEAVVVRQVHDDARVVRVVLDDQAARTRPD